MKRFRYLLKKRSEDNFFWHEVKTIYCLLASRIDKFVSLHKSHHLLGEVLSFRQIHHIVISSLLAWSLQIMSPSLDEVLQIWVMVPWSSAVLRLLGAPGHISTGGPSPPLLPSTTPPSCFYTTNLIA